MGRTHGSRALAARLCLVAALLSPVSCTVWTAVRGGVDPALGEEMWRLAEQGRYEEALPLARADLAQLEPVFGPDHPWVATALYNLAWLHALTGDPALAEPLFQRSLAIRERELGADHPAVARTLDGLAFVCWATGDDARAEPLYQRALRVTEAAYGPEHRQLLRPLDGLAQLYYDAGEPARAEPIYRRWLAVAEEVLAPGDPLLAGGLHNLGLVAWARGDFAEAEALYERSLALSEQAVGPDNREIARILHNQALLYEDTGDYARAEPLYERSLAIDEQHFGAEHPVVADRLESLARLSLQAGDYTRAEALYQRSLALYESALGPQDPRVNTLRGYLAILRWRAGRADEANALFQLSFEHAVEDPERFLPMLAERQARALLWARGGMDDVLVSFQRAHPEVPGASRRALTAILRRKSRELDVSAGRLAALRRSLAEGDRAAFDALVRARTRLARVVLRGPGDTPPGKYRGLVAELRREAEQAERAAFERSADLRAALAPFELDDVQRRIPEDAALLELSSFRDFDPARATQAMWGAERYGAFLLRRRGDPVWVDLGTSESLASRVRAFRAGLRATPPAAEQGRDAAGRALHDILVAPLASELDGLRLLLVAPDGVLGLVPFAALPDAPGRQRYLVERLAVAYQSSGRDLLRRRRPDEASAAPAVIGAPDHEGAEVEAVAGLLGVEATTGAAASEAHVESLRDPRILHLAARCFFLSDQRLPPPRAFDLAGMLAPGMRRLAEAGQQNPLLRAGVVLAGASRRDGAGEDGVLTAVEAAALDLDATGLVVLSACDPAPGEANGGAVSALRGALMLAGARSQVGVLWQAGAVATRRFVQAYYARLLAGEPVAEALRRTQLELLADPQLRHPAAWAGFVPIGDWRPLAGAGS